VCRVCLCVFLYVTRCRDAYTICLHIYTSTHPHIHACILVYCICSYVLHVLHGFIVSLPLTQLCRSSGLRGLHVYLSTCRTCRYVDMWMHGMHSNMHVLMYLSSCLAINVIYPCSPCSHTAANVSPCTCTYSCLYVCMPD